MERWLDIGAAVFALIAAGFWFLSVHGKLPPMLTYWDQTPADDPFYVAARFSAKMNTWAAGLMGTGTWLVCRLEPLVALIALMLMLVALAGWMGFGIGFHQHGHTQLVAVDDICCSAMLMASAVLLVALRRASMFGPMAATSFGGLDKGLEFCPMLR
jgi:hypothetical protein